MVLGAYGLSYLCTKVTLPPHLEAAGQWQFLTNLSLVFSICVYLLGAAAHMKRSPALFALKNNLHPIALVLESVVTVIYWPLRLLFLQFLVKDPNHKFIPLFVDLCLHFVPVLVLLVDFFVFMPRWTISPAISAATCMVLSALYYVWLKVLIDVNTGAEYPYNFLNVPSELQRVVIFGAVAFVGFLLFCGLSWLYDIVKAPRTDAKKNL